MCPVPENILLLENNTAFIFPRAWNAVQAEIHFLLGAFVINEMLFILFLLHFALQKHEYLLITH